MEVIKMAKLSIDEIINAVKELTVLELNELVKKSEEVFGVSAAAAASAGPAGPVEVVEEKTEFDVELTSIQADKKINIIKVVRAITGLGLKEAKDVVDNAPKMIKEQAPKDEAESLKKKLEEAGATVTLK
jgi:large subunit ribosomal protein L7/L12